MLISTLKVIWLVNLIQNYIRDLIQNLNMTNCSAVELIYSGEIEKLCLFQKEMKQRRIRYSNYFI